MRRRTWLAGTLAVALAGCGFALRQAPDFSFSSIYLAMPESSPLALELRRQLEATGRMRVIVEPEKQDEAEVILRSAGEEREQVVVSMTSAGQVREFQQRLRLNFSASTRDGRELITPTEIERHMDQSYSESAALSKEQETALLYRSMQSDIVQQVMQRLARIER